MVLRHIEHRLLRQAVILMAILFFTESHAQFVNEEIVAKIQIERNSEFYTFTSTAENLTPFIHSLRYEFLAFKTDENNNTEKNEQIDRIVLEANTKKLLSTVTIYNNIEGKIILNLTIYNLEDKVVGRDRVVLQYDKELKSLEIEEVEKPKVINSISELAKIAGSPDEAPPQDGYIRYGFIVENTLTKAGRDFYRYFYSEFSLKGIKTDKNILIEEVPGRTRSTKVSVEVEGQLVWQFYAQPRKEFLKQMAETALDRVIRRLQQLEKQKNDLIRY